MTTQTETLKLALKALKKSDGFLYNWHENYADDEADAYAAARQLNEQAIIAAEKALAQPEQEPVANGYVFVAISILEKLGINKAVIDTIATTPPQRTWVGLTDEEFFAIWNNSNLGPIGIKTAIEAKLKEKNT